MAVKERGHMRETRLEAIELSGLRTEDPAHANKGQCPWSAASDVRADVQMF